MRFTQLTIGLILLAASTAHASGFILMNHGAHATGRGNAYTANPQDASAIWYNPAGITGLEGYQVYVGGTLIRPQGEFEPADGTDTVSTEDRWVVTPSIYASAKLSDLLSVGLGVNPPYGSGLSWGEESPGRDIIREISLRTWYITPVIGFDFSSLGVQGLSLALGPDIVMASAYLRQDILFGTEVGQAELGGRGMGFSGRVGLQYKPAALPELAIGLMYRHGVPLTLEGNADFDIAPELRSALPPDGDGSVELTIPNQIEVGVAYKVMPELEIEVNGGMHGWSSYDELTVTLPNDTTSISRKDWEDTFEARVGFEYSPGVWAVRAGYIYDPTPIPNTTIDFTLPDADRNSVTLGGGYELADGLVADASVWFLLPGSLETGTVPGQPREKGTYTISAWTASVSIGYTFNPAPVAVVPAAEEPAAAPAPAPAEAPAEAAPAAEPAPATDAPGTTG